MSSQDQDPGSYRPEVPHQYGGYQGLPAHPDESNNMALAGFATSLAALVLCQCIAPLSLILSVMGMKKEKHKGLAITGLVISMISLLLLVITIPLLAAIAVPAFQKARVQATENACLENQRIIEAGFEQYWLEVGMEDPVDVYFDLEEDTGDAIGALVEEGYLRYFPVCPAGGQYEFVVENGEVWIECSQPEHLNLTGSTMSSY